MDTTPRPRCAAKTRLGGRCKARPVRASGRCKWHGGCSTGPRTAEGKAKVALNLPRISALIARSKSGMGQLLPTNAMTMGPHRVRAGGLTLKGQDAGGLLPGEP